MLGALNALKAPSNQISNNNVFRMVSFFATYCFYLKKNFNVTRFFTLLKLFDTRLNLVIKFFKIDIAKLS